MRKLKYEFDLNVFTNDKTNKLNLKVYSIKIEFKTNSSHIQFR